MTDNEDAKAEDSSGKIVDTCDKQMKRNTPFTIFVGQIPYDAKEEEVRKLFEKAGMYDVTMCRAGWRFRRLRLSCTVLCTDLIGIDRCNQDISMAYQSGNKEIQRLRIR